MKRLIPILALLCFAAPVYSQTLVQSNDLTDWSWTMSNQQAANGTTVNIWLPRPTGAGNLLVLSQTIDDGGATTLPTVTDDKSNTWVAGVRCNDSTNGESIVGDYAANVASGTREITITFHAANAFGQLPLISEWSGIATTTPLDKSTCVSAATNTGTSISAGASGTLGHSGDLIIQTAWNDTLSYTNTTSNPGNGVHYTAGSAGSLTWKLLNNSSDWAFGSEYAIYNATATITPTFTISTAKAVSQGLYFIASAGAGTPVPAGIQVLSRKDQPTLTFTTTPTFYFAGPSAANLLVANWTGGPVDMTALTDSNSNSYSSTTAQHCDSNTPTPITCVHNRYAGSATVSEGMHLSPTFASTPGNDFVELYAIKGAASSPFDKQVSASGDQISAGNLTYLSISPSTSNGLVLFAGSLDFNTHATFTSPSGALTETCFQSNEPTSTGGCMANNPFGNFLNSGTTSETWTSSFKSGVTAVNWWTGEADAYEAPAASVVRHRAWVIQ